MRSRPSRTQLLQQLQALSLFAVLEAETLADLADHARWRTFAAGEIVFWEGEPAVGLYFIQSGWLKIVTGVPSGREQVLHFLGPGETFNEIGAFANQPNPATAVVLEAAGIWLIGREILMRLLTERPSFAQHLIEALAGRVLHLVSLVADLSLRPVTGRLARLLLDSTTENVLDRPRWYTQAELAARLGTVPDVVQRALRQLENEGLIVVERRRIEILNRPALEALAGQ